MNEIEFLSYLIIASSKDVLISQDEINRIDINIYSDKDKMILR